MIIRIGDVVQAKCGGPTMVVICVPIDCSWADCTWWNPVTGLFTGSRFDKGILLTKEDVKDR